MAQSKTKKISILPTADRVLVQVKSADENVSKSGIIIPETISKEKPEEGIVMAAGPGRLNDSGALIPVRVKAGDRILFSKYGPDEVKVDGETYYILREDQILAVVQ